MADNSKPQTTTKQRFVPVNEALPSSLNWMRGCLVKIYHHTQKMNPTKDVKAYNQEFSKELDTDKIFNVSDLRVRFSVRRCALHYPNQAIIQIYNLNRDTENAIIQQGYRIVVEAGYGKKEQGSEINNNYGQIFDGSIIMCTRQKQDGVDYVLNILAIDGDPFLNNAFCNFSYKKGQTAYEVVDSICSRASNPIHLQYASPSLKEIVLSKGGVVYGQPKKVLADLAKTINGTWFIDNGEFHMLSYADSADKLPGGLQQAVELNSKTGLVGNPQQVNYGVQARCLLNPKIMPYGLIHLPSRYITEQMVQAGGPPKDFEAANTLDPEEIYRVCSVTFTGDTRGNEWYSDITAVDQGGDMMSMLTDPSYTAN